MSDAVESITRAQLTPTQLPYPPNLRRRWVRDQSFSTDSPARIQLHLQARSDVSKPIKPENSGIEFQRSVMRNAARTYNQDIAGHDWIQVLELVAATIDRLAQPPDQRHDTRVTGFNVAMTEDQRALRDLSAQIAKEVYEPRATQWDLDGNFLPDEERKRLAGLDLLGITLPIEYGGSGRPLLDALIVIEEIAKVCQLAAFPIFEATTGPARVVELFGTADQKRRLLPPVVRGDKTIAVAISEADAGSAATDAQTQAHLDGDQVVINGVKRWCSGAGHAEQYLVYVRLGPEAGAAGLGALVVDKDSVGLTFGPQEKLMGFHGVGSADMFFEDVRVPRDNLIVAKGGFKQLFTAFSIERIGNATMSLAIGQSCLDRCAGYVVERRQFGRAVLEFQLVQASLADMIVQVEAARLLIYRAAANAGRGAPAPLEASIAKYFANEMAKRVSDLAIQLHGGYGYTAEYGVERLHRDSHGWAIAGGTSNMQKLRIVSEYMGRRFNQRRR